MVLYAAGASFNLMVHLVLRVLKADEPGFFSGYDSFGAVMVVISNIFIGLAITAVYKCNQDMLNTKPTFVWLIPLTRLQMRMLSSNVLLPP